MSAFKNFFSKLFTRGKKKLKKKLIEDVLPKLKEELKGVAQKDINAAIDKVFKELVNRL
jgi:hypothetical protein